MLRPAEDEDADDEGHRCHEEARREGLHLRQAAQVDDFTEGVEEVGERVVGEQGRVFRRDDLFRVEDGRGVAECCEEDTVEVEHVAEVDDASGEQEADAEAEHEEQQDGHEEAQDAPGRQDACVDHHEEDGWQCEDEVDAA